MLDKTGVQSYLVVGCRIYYSVKKASWTQNVLTLQNTAGRAVTSVDRREPVRKSELILVVVHHLILLKGTSTLTTSWF